MQSSAPEFMDLKQESKETLALYGVEPGKPSFATNCLLARRLAERGVRFVNLFHEGWDHHSDVAGGLKTACGQTDQGAAALVSDLKRRGMLDDTLVVWGGEFGRTPMVESNATLGRSLGRDHHPAGLHHVARRRRASSPGRRSARPTSWASTSSRTPSTSTTCRRRSCTCSGSITRD